MSSVLELTGFGNSAPGRDGRVTRGLDTGKGGAYMVAVNLPPLILQGRTRAGARQLGREERHWLGSRQGREGREKEEKCKL